MPKVPFLTKPHMTSAAFAANPIDIIAQDHTLQEDLCDLLERIADSLPSSVDRGIAENVLGYLDNDLAVHIRDEEEGLFPLLEAHAATHQAIPGILERLTDEHAIDAFYAEEVCEELRMLASGREPHNANSLGYLLRGFFETQRRHLAWENMTILPLARQLLTPADLGQLSKQLALHRR